MFEEHSPKTTPSFTAFGLLLTTFGALFMASASSLAQVDIYQSDAYSVEEMCARQADQSSAANYDAAYEQCIDNNGDKPMYRSGTSDKEAGLAAKGTADEGTIRSNL